MIKKQTDFNNPFEDSNKETFKLYDNPWSKKMSKIVSKNFDTYLDDYFNKKDENND